MGEGMSSSSSSSEEEDEEKAQGSRFLIIHRRSSTIGTARVTRKIGFVNGASGRPGTTFCEIGERRRSAHLRQQLVDSDVIPIHHVLGYHIVVRYIGVLEQELSFLLQFGDVRLNGFGLGGVALDDFFKVLNKSIEAFDFAMGPSLDAVLAADFLEECRTDAH